MYSTLNLINIIINLGLIMIIRGKKLRGPNIEYIVIPRQDEDIVFKAEAILSMDDFDKLCPMPKPPQITKRGVGLIDDVEDKSYKIALNQRNTRRMDWIIIQSIRNTEGLEWEQVQYDDPNTWHLYKEELRESGFGDYEINRIINGVLVANSLDEKKLQEARDRFLSGQSAQQTLSSHQEDQLNTRNGERVKDSILDHQV